MGYYSYIAQELKHIMVGYDELLLPAIQILAIHNQSNFEHIEDLNPSTSSYICKFQETNISGRSKQQVTQAISYFQFENSLGSISFVEFIPWSEYRGTSMGGSHDSHILRISSLSHDESFHSRFTLPTEFFALLPDEIFEGGNTKLELVDVMPEYYSEVDFSKFGYLEIQYQFNQNELYKIEGFLRLIYRDLKYRLSDPQNPDILVANYDPVTEPERKLREYIKRVLHLSKSL